MYRKVLRQSADSNYRQPALLIDHYDSGRLSRRELLGALAMLALPGTQASAAPKIGAAKQINYATLFVRDVEQSRAFYQRLFGMPVLTAQPPGVNLAVGGGFLGLHPIDHIISVDRKQVLV